MNESMSNSWAYDGPTKIGLDENRNGSVVLANATTIWPYLIGSYHVRPVRVVGQPVGAKSMC